MFDRIIFQKINHSHRRTYIIMKKIFGIVLGAMLIAGSVLAILNITNIVPIDISLDGWWSLFIIVPAVNGLISDRRDASNSVPKTAQLTINGFCMFGGADIK